jgi:flagellar biosynthesis protein FlhG
MSDQAAELRQLMQTLADRRGSPPPRPRIVVTWGAARHVGTTAIAVNLAVELARHNRRVVLVDADPAGGAARLCRLHEPGAAHRNGSTSASLADVFRGRRELPQAIRRGMHGLRVVGNFGGDATTCTPTDEEVDTLAAAIRTLGNEADLVLIDAGWGPSPPAERLALHADLVLKITTPADAAIMDAYAAIKRMAAAKATAKVAALLSRCAAVVDAEEAFGRLRHGCRRFLNIEVDWAGCVVEDTTVADAVSCAAPFVVLSPRCEASRGIQQAAEYLLGALPHTTNLSPTANDDMNVAARSDTRPLVAVGDAA